MRYALHLRIVLALHTMSKKIFTVEEGDAGTRLDLYLATRMAELSRSKVQQLIEAGAVTVNNTAKTKHYALRPQDEVSIDADATPPAPTEPAKRPTRARRTHRTAAKPQTEEPVVLAETDEYIIVQKPSGMLVHRTEHSKSITLSDWAVARYPEIAKVGVADRPGIVHRLDRDVSGVMVVARTQKMFDALKAQFKNREVHKVYTALVHSAPAAEDGDINFPIARSQTRAAMAARPLNQAGRPAHTYYCVTRRFQKKTLLHVEPKTGRTHQIRVHLYALGMPIVADPIYQLPSYEQDTMDRTLPRIFLHATELSFTDATGATVKYTSPLPEVLESALAKLV